MADATSPGKVIGSRRPSPDDRWHALTPKQKAATEPWMRNKADELAVKNGCWFDPLRAMFMIWWVERYCRLYEGEGFAGNPCIMPSVADQPTEWNEVPEMFPDFYSNGKPIRDVVAFYTDRMEWHNSLFHSGAAMHWQFECHARIYGWQRPAAERWKRVGIHQVRRFRTANVWIPKKSGKSPSLGFNTLYLTMGDNEPGGKTFIAAKDGTQATRVWDHAFQMLQQSPELVELIKPNLTTKRVTYLPTKSYFEPLSSSNKNTMESKEGLNGNILVDEMHVVDREFMTILEFAGASRAQPLNLGFSTAGKNPEGFGKQEWDRGERINAGLDQVDNYFHQSYHAPQDLTVTQMEEDPERYIRMANPAIDHTVGMEELLPAFHQCKRSPAEFAKYSMYRLNVWQHAAQAWLAPHVWADCGGHKFDEEELQSRPGVLGIDLARKFDLAAAVAAWPNKLSGVDLRAWFWCNEKRIREISAKHPAVLDWVNAGLIRVNPDNVTDLRVVKRDLRKLIREYNFVGMVYDPHYAETIIQDLTTGEIGPDGELMFEPENIAEQSMSQGILTQTGPVADFENDLLSKKIRHEDNPVLTWQFGHATVVEDRRGHRQIVKENRKSFRTVDGCQAAVMARWGALDNRDWKLEVLNHYEENDVEFI